ncbi:MAG: carboxypeptidase-like regulatory domain-containing protein [Gammaproteobacteria bacterium]
MRKAAVVFCLFLLAAGFLAAQVIVTGKLSGTVTDATGAVVPNARVRVWSDETGTTFHLATNEVGAYFLAAVPSGTYSVEVIAPGFRKGVVRGVKVDVSNPALADVKLEVGATTETVQVEAAATPIATETTTVGTTITGRQITELPFTSRDALDLALLMPGASSGGAPRATSFNALPKGAINITMDGLNTQDNLLKSSFGGGFFTYIRPRIDAIDEFSISTAVAGAESAAEGAVQIKFVTKRGTNNWHGGLFWYHRNTALNANYYFNNLTGQRRQEMKLNQWGGKAGGPIIKNRLFIFGVFDEFRLPESRLRTRTVLKTEAVDGNFRYLGTDGAERVVNLLQVAGAANFPSTPDPAIRAALTKIDSLRSGGQAGITPSDRFRDLMSFNNPGSQLRRFPTGRLDWNINDRVQWEAVWNYQYFSSFPDNLNSADRTYPGFERIGNFQTEGGQYSNRFSVTTALRWLVTPHMNNEFRYGVSGGTVAFRPEINPRMFNNDMRVAFPLSLTSPLTLALPSRRNTPIKQFSDNLGWARGRHTLNFGGSFTLLTAWDQSLGNAVPTASLGVVGSDPVAAVIGGANLPAISAGDLTNARALYALLTGRISQTAGVINVNEKENKYAAFSPLTRRERQIEYGIYATDNWRLRPTLTLNYGLRWEFQGVPTDTNGIYTSPGYDGLWGRSGVGNLFRPGTLAGSATAYNLRNGAAYRDDWNNFAPSFGFAWSPASENSLLKAVFGKGGAFRAGYSISYNREGLNHYRSYAGNPGPTARTDLFADRDYPAGSLLLRNPIPAATPFPASFSFPLAQSVFTYSTTGPLWFDPNLRVPYVQSWSAGIQREVFKDTVLEARYVGNHGTSLWRATNINEVNIFENGFLQEFIAAQNNLSICAASRAACTGSATGALRFDNRGLAGQANLPILSAAFSGVALASGFGSGTFVTQLQEGQAGRVANTIGTSGTFFPNMLRGGYPANFFFLNPDAAGASVWLLQNASHSTYHALQVELRRRFSRGLQFNTNYTWSHGLTDYYADSSDSSSTFITLRNTNLNKGVSPYDIRHQIKSNWIYELPFGDGQRWRTGSGVVDRIIGGWEFHGIARLQSGRPFKLNSGRWTVNQQDSGIIPKISRDQLQSMVKVVKDPNRRVYYLDRRLIGADGRANPEFFETPTTPGQQGTYLHLYGPRFIRFDLSAVKKTRIRESLNVEIRAEFLNAFNNINFMVGGPTAAQVFDIAGTNIQNTSFGRITDAYNDISTTSDPGGRIVQLVLRINF